jgi:hypothetical protein
MLGTKIGRRVSYPYYMFNNERTKIKKNKLQLNARKKGMLAVITVLKY